MLRTEDALAEGSHRAMLPLCVRMFALGLQRDGQIVPAPQAIGMLRAEDEIEDGGGFAVESLGDGILSARTKVTRQTSQQPPVMFQFKARLRRRGQEMFDVRTQGAPKGPMIGMRLVLRGEFRHQRASFLQALPPGVRGLRLGADGDSHGAVDFDVSVVPEQQGKVGQFRERLARDTFSQLQKHALGDGCGGEVGGDLDQRAGDRAGLLNGHGVGAQHAVGHVFHLRRIVGESPGGIGGQERAVFRPVQPLVRHERSGLLEGEGQAAEFTGDDESPVVGTGLVPAFCAPLLEEFHGIGFLEAPDGLAGKLFAQAGEPGGDEPAHGAGLMAERAHGGEGFRSVGIVRDDEGRRHRAQEAQGEQHEVLGAGLGIVGEGELRRGIGEGTAQRLRTLRIEEEPQRICRPVQPRELDGGACLAHAARAMHGHRLGEGDGLAGVEIFRDRLEQRIAPDEIMLHGKGAVVEGIRRGPRCGVKGELGQAPGLRDGLLEIHGGVVPRDDNDAVTGHRTLGRRTPRAWVARTGGYRFGGGAPGTCVALTSPFAFASCDIAARLRLVDVHTRRNGVRGLTFRRHLYTSAFSLELSSATKHEEEDDEDSRKNANDVERVVHGWSRT